MMMIGSRQIAYNGFGLGEVAEPKAKLKNKMGEYRFSIYAKWQLGLSISFDGQIVIGLPFLNIHFATSKYASGVYILGKEFY